MADEIKNNNVIVVTKEEDGLWRARIGPRERGVSVEAVSAPTALVRLAVALIQGGWIFDPSYRPRTATGPHDA